jgi:hypothetical protein
MVRPPIQVLPYVVNLELLDRTCRSAGAHCDHPLLCAVWAVGCGEPPGGRDA